MKLNLAMAGAAAAVLVVGSMTLAGAQDASFEINACVHNRTGIMPRYGNVYGPGDAAVVELGGRPGRPGRAQGTPTTGWTRASRPPGSSSTLGRPSRSAEHAIRGS